MTKLEQRISELAELEKLLREKEQEACKLANTMSDRPGGDKSMADSIARDLRNAAQTASRLQSYLQQYMQ